MKPTLMLLLSVLVGLTACKSPKPEHDDAREHGHDEAAEEKLHVESGDVIHVHVPQEMLRDLRVTTAKVEARPGGESVTALGELTFSEDAYAEVSSPVSARVASVAVTTGQAVKQGQRLAELQSPELGRARADLQATQARATAARQAADRKRTLAEERIVARKDAQAAEADAAAAEAEVAAAKAALAALGAGNGGEGTSGFVLKAPIGGTVVERAARLGQMADPSQALFRIGDLSSLWLIVHAFERDAVRLKPGADARVTFAAFPGQEFAAKVGHVGQRVDPHSRTIPVRLELDNGKGLLRPGMSASASIPLGDPGATLTAVPTASLQRLENGWVVFLPTPEAGVFEQREVGRGRSLGTQVEVLKGLAVGDEVVVEGAFLLKAEVEKSQGGGDEHGH
ncbi:MULTISPECIES: efflux RND transporter periplasmic adaptor subunit [unclassified Corallococcus]|uniref:efflux RND transporter periplasmic adaptor subunit n=1 Tax=unclassified Corallococcus TaxID=2685029 RepID=UPI001A8DB610|nr:MULTISPECIES: efflux RND transporter periplasmic adaptor subunit [unclassified Corallococcus]MBN9685515.1 efflux RND transporter periplasmic adaptor subunit [Corallococcus sp. NCSPR001]WAS83037.1 efflux RND transporter periplasmic adaptor subunit [Corallococcus sp. NCRR]